MSRESKYSVGNIIDTPKGKIKILKRVSLNNNSRKPQVVIKFLKTGWICKVYCCNIPRGYMKDRLEPSVYGMGYFGTNIKIHNDGSLLQRIYYLWLNMLKRCYCRSSLEERPTYKECQVSDEWLSFKNFLNTIKYVPNYDLWVNNHDMALDKDIRIEGNKIYSVDTCCFVHKGENTRDATIRRCKKQGEPNCQQQN